MIPLGVIIPLSIGLYAFISTITSFAIRELIGKSHLYWSQMAEDDTVVSVLGGMTWPISWFVILGVLVSKHILKKIKEHK